MQLIPVVDLFAGPGGLNEGFSSLDDGSGRPVFNTVGSYEMENSANDTLTLRAAYHRARRSGDDEIYYRFLRDEIPYASLEADHSFGVALREARQHVHRIELGENTRDHYGSLIREKSEPRAGRGGSLGARGGARRARRIRLSEGRAGPTIRTSSMTRSTSCTASTSTSSLSSVPQCS